MVIYLYLFKIIDFKVAAFYAIYYNEKVDIITSNESLA